MGACPPFIPDNMWPLDYRAQLLVTLELPLRLRLQPRISLLSARTRSAHLRPPPISLNFTSQSFRMGHLPPGSRWLSPGIGSSPNQRLPGRLPSRAFQMTTISSWYRRVRDSLRSCRWFARRLSGNREERLQLFMAFAIHKISPMRMSSPRSPQRIPDLPISQSRAERMAHSPGARGAFRRSSRMARFNSHQRPTTCFSVVIPR